MKKAHASAAMAAAAYTVWKKSTPILYDFFISEALEWPSLTVQWLPSSYPCSPPSIPSGDGRGLTHRLLLGTHTCNQIPNYLMVAEVLFSPSIPSPAPPPVSEAPIPKVEILQSIPHQGEVNRARFMPQRMSVVATKTCGPEVHLFDGCRWPLYPKNGDSNDPDVILRGHKTEGYGLAWSPFKEGHLLSGSYDSKICLWDVQVTPEEKILHAKNVFEAHEAQVEDVAWHMKNEHLFGSVGDDRRLMIWDLRSSSSKMPQQSIIAHGNEVNSLTFSPFNEWFLATASGDATLKLFDLRKLTTSLHTFSGHNAATLQVAWSPKHETIFASSAADNRLMVWDLSRIGEEQSEEDAEDGQPELLFVHNGHTDMISEFSWSPDEPWVIASVAENNILHVWQMAENIYREDYDVNDNGDS